MEQLELERQRLDVRISEVDSLDNIKKDKGDMEDVEDPDFLVIKENVNYVYNY
jgi:hypothetical protein